MQAGTNRVGIDGGWFGLVMLWASLEKPRALPSARVVERSLAIGQTLGD